MANQETELLQKRATALAIVHLTRRDDVIIIEHEPHFVFDLLAEIKYKGAKTGRFFGVEVRHLKTEKQIHRTEKDGNEFAINIKNLPIPQDVPFPVCLLVFCMDTDAGYYRWIKEPSRQLEGQLRLNQRNVFSALDRKSLDEIIATVNAWYESRLKIPA